MREVDLAIIGGGPAGMAAAIEAKKNGVNNVVILEREKELGGILQQCIHNGFGLHIFGEELTGPEYAGRFIEQVKGLKIEYYIDTMVVNISSDRIITAINSKEGLIKLKAKAVILAMGCRERSRGALNIPGTRPAGIYTAGTAQRFVNIEGYIPGQKIVILGSGDIGLIMARRLTLEGAEVRMVCELQPFSGGLRRNIVQCLEDFNIPLFLSYTVVKIHGKDRLEGVTIAKVDENRRPIADTCEYVECDTLLLSVGLIPECELPRETGILIDTRTGGPVVNEAMETCSIGIFACGNVVHVHDLVDYVTEESRLAGYGAANHITRGLVEGSETIRLTAGNGISYVVPQIIRKTSMSNNIKIFFRVSGIYKNVKIIIMQGDRIVGAVKRMRVAPGEMESIIITKQMLSELEDCSNLTIFAELP